MSDIGNYYGSFEAGKKYQEQGDYTRAAIEYWMCMQYYHHGEFPVGVDKSIMYEARHEYNNPLLTNMYAPLSKTTYIKGCQCLKALWMYKHKYNERVVSEELQKKFNEGHNIGALALKLFPDGEDASWMENKDKCLKELQQRSPIKIYNFPAAHRQALWCQRTKEFMDKGTTHIYEAAFTNGLVFAAVDVLELNNEKTVAYEVKSTYDVKDVFIQDCALQYHVINKNVPLDDFVLITINKEYFESLGVPLNELTEENCDINKLFKMQSILEDVKALQEKVVQNIKRMEPMVYENEEPSISMGEHCSKPYQCEFQQYCSRCSKSKMSFFKRLFGVKRNH